MPLSVESLHRVSSSAPPSANSSLSRAEMALCKDSAGSAEMSLSGARCRSSASSDSDSERSGVRALRREGEEKPDEEE